MWNWLYDPQLFNKIILSLYALSCIRFLLAQSWWDLTYAIGAVLIMCSIAFR